MEIKKIGVLGAGTMGAGIAQVAAEAGFSVILVDIETAIIEKALKGIKKAWKKAVEKGKLDEGEMQKREGNLATGSSMADFKDCDVVIEAIVEKIEVKKVVFKELDGICPEHTILASNTSALSITEIAAATGRPDRVVGMHFFNPVPVMKLVEVIPGAETSEAVSSAIVELCKKLKKEPVLAREFPGFIVNRILVPYITETCSENPAP
ncbi:MULTISPECIES: 3-hydroxyacyl-CoA dehydrogenase family protein [Bacillati]|uniref:3-hydroxybutyryl-CoA dehydrogenase n=1 Tax=Syntrophomonas wolfei subsp. wolfei (strain DSM 2245B / Goettingen) TaxID=335541 RepID=Q0AZT1_SYNWW|nr:3-hydroxyacyl-CoA dehydrogenase NAD-binding domain-containing protein [Syntrophomonas wolfei]ABI67773.1 3-hydroxyacyl-CoA dehydrogenase [Syntrophomonas wolfei subsp. wolfei str. Goettingen G311]